MIYIPNKNVYVSLPEPMHKRDVAVRETALYWTIHKRPSTTNVRLLSLGNEESTAVSARVNESQS